MIRLFCGYDEREEPGLHVFMSSVIRRTTEPVSLTPLTSQGLRQGSNTFTLSRFLVPVLCGFSGRAIFCDGTDMVALGNMAELYDMFDPRYAVQVVKHPAYISFHNTKYVGTEMECRQSNYVRKNWASVMLINCGHHAWRDIQKNLAEMRSVQVLQFGFLSDDQIGDLPPQWNVLADEGQVSEDPKILHWTAGIPHFKHYASAPYSNQWFAERDVAWQERK